MGKSFGLSCAALVLSLSLFFTTSAYADVVGTVKVEVSDPDGNPVEGLYAVLKVGASGTHFAYSDAQGMLTFFSVNEGDYTLDLKCSTSTTCTTCGRYADQSSAISISKSSPQYNSGLDRQTLDEIALQVAGRYITVTVTSGTSPVAGAIQATGDPVPGIYISGYDSSNSSNYGAGITGSDGKAYIQVASGNTSLWGVSAYSSNGAYSPASRYNIQVAASGETAVSLVVIPTDTTINFSLTKDGVPYAIPSGSYGSISCSHYSTIGNYYFSGFLEPTETGEAVNVLGGLLYTCNAYVQGLGSSSVTLTPSIGVTESGTITLFERDASVTVRLVDPNGQVISGTGGTIFASAIIDRVGNPLADYVSGTETNGSAALALIDGGIYRLSLYFPNSSSSLGVRGVITSTSGNQYIVPTDMVSVTADKNNPQTVDIELLPADATINVVVKNSNGQALQNAYVSAVEQNNTPNTQPLYTGRSTNSSGQASLPVVGGKTYSVFAYPQESFGGNIIPPPTQQVTLAQNGSASLSFSAVTADYTLSINASITSESGIKSIPTNVSCYGYTANQHSFVPNVINGQATLYLTSGDTWQIGCTGYSGTKIYRSANTSLNTNGSSGSLSVELHEGGDYYQPTNFSFSCTSATTLTLQDGKSTLYIPANALDTSGTCSLEVKSAIGSYVSSTLYPVFGFSFTARDENGEKVQTFSQNLILTLKYNLNQLPQNVSATGLTGQHYDEDTRTYSAPVAVAIQTNGTELSFELTLNEFSSYSIVGSTGSGPNVPTKLKAKQKKSARASGNKKAYELSWRGPSGASSYQFQFRKKKGGKSDKVSVGQRFKKAKIKSSSKTKATVKFATGNYEFRVRAVNSSGLPGSYSNPKSFSVK